MSYNMVILYFRLLYFMSQIVLYFQHSASVLSFYIYVVSTLSTEKEIRFKRISCTLSPAYIQLSNQLQTGHWPVKCFLPTDHLNYSLRSASSFDQTNDPIMQGLNARCNISFKLYCLLLYGYLFLFLKPVSIPIFNRQHGLQTTLLNVHTLDNQTHISRSSNINQSHCSFRRIEQRWLCEIILKRIVLFTHFYQVFLVLMVAEMSLILRHGVICGYIVKMWYDALKCVKWIPSRTCSNVSWLYRGIFIYTIYV